MSTTNIDEEWNLWTTFVFLVNALMMVTPTLAYFAQINTIKKQKSSLGFSKKIPLLLLLSSILRIFFWFGKKFHWSLLGQAVFMTIMQVYMVKICIQYDPTIEKKKENSVFNYKNFWDWGYLSYYITFLITFTFSIHYLFAKFTYDNDFLVELIGSLSAMVEASFVLPQVFTNYSLKSTDSLSLIVVANWVFGDVVKTYFFFQTSAPIQLKLCGITQLGIDFVIIFQMCYYRGSSNNKSTIMDNTYIKDVEFNKEL